MVGFARSVTRNHHHRYVYLFTGTPVTNTLAEMYVLQRYLMPERLAALGMETFAAWAAAFVEFVAQIEVAPDGGSFRMHRRPARFANVPELRRLLAEVAEIVTAEQLHMAVPEAVHETVVVEPAPQLKDYIATLVERADAIRNREVDPSEDNMLKVCSDGRKAALWLPLVGVHTEHPGKIEAAVERILAIWREHRVLTDVEPEVTEPTNLFAWAEVQARRRRNVRSGEAFQLVFCDLGTPHPGDGQVYGQIRAALVRGGMEPGRIRFIHEARTDTAKAALFADCRAGCVDVLLGSTEKLSTGTNVQRLLVAIHHVDAPWRPADREQRNGRGIRPGNRNGQVRIITYVTEGSFDAYMWEALHRKARFIEQVLTGDLTARVVEDVGDGTLSYAEIKALATGNPLLMRLAEAEAEVVKLRHLGAAHKRNMNRLRQEADRREAEARRLDSRAGLREHLALVTSYHREADLRPSRFAPVVPGHGEIGANLAQAAPRAMVGDGQEVACGTWRGLEVGVKATRPWRGEWALSLCVEASYRRDELDFPATWLEKGQWWRLTRVLEIWLEESKAKVTAWRAEAERLLAAAEEARAHAARPFERAGEIAAALARRKAIEKEIRATVREAAQPEPDEAEAA